MFSVHILFMVVCLCLTIPCHRCVCSIFVLKTILLLVDIFNLHLFLLDKFIQGTTLCSYALQFEFWFVDTNNIGCWILDFLHASEKMANYWGYKVSNGFYLTILLCILVEGRSFGNVPTKKTE